MESLGINIGLLFVQLISMITLIGFPVASLIDLKKKKMTGAALAIWALIICAVPLLGPLAYWIIKPSAE
ncbi:MAG: hypothetical protein KA480_06890 [Anaerolineales bacterium]|nr:hypothetical protein [Anaerolineales bacterium]